MYGKLSERAISEGEYIVENNATVRSTAAVFGVGKSTVHKDVTVALKEIDANLYGEVKKVLEKNLSERHIRGGLATKLKNEKIRELESDMFGNGRVFKEVY